VQRRTTISLLRVALPFLFSDQAEDSQEMGGRVHLVSLTRFWRSGAPQFPGSTLDGHLSLGDAGHDFLAVLLQNGFSVERQPVLICVRIRHW
jgi:hypothetical protein